MAPSVHTAEPRKCPGQQVIGCRTRSLQSSGNRDLSCYKNAQATLELGPLTPDSITCVYLTKNQLEAVSAEACEGIGDCNQIIDIHGRQTAHSVLNPYLVLSAVSVWERYIVNLLGASEVPGWNPKTHDEFSSPAPWPWSAKDQRRARKSGGRHDLDARLIQAQALDEPVTYRWHALVSTDYRGSDPRRWRQGSFSPNANPEARDILRQGLLGAKSARDAVAHRIYHLKAAEAESRQDIEKWHFTWSSDTYVRTGNPKIQNGYARGVVALFIQLIECTSVAIAIRHGWDQGGVRLPADWFEDRDRWNIGRLSRAE
jgi:hypothetical protein